MDTLPERVLNLEARMNTMEKDVAVFCEVIKESVEVQKELSTTIKDFGGVITDIKMTLIKMQGEITNNTTGLADIKTKIDKVDDRARAADDKSKIDVVAFLTQNIWKIIFSGATIIAALKYAGII